MSDTDWLEGDTDEKRREVLRKETEFAELYLLFDDNPRGRALLEQWDTVFLHKRTPLGSSLDQYGADEAVRDFIRGVHRQVHLAKQKQE